jgi:hypothetical protein
MIWNIYTVDNEPHVKSIQFRCLQIVTSCRRHVTNGLACVDLYDAKFIQCRIPMRMHLENNILLIRDLGWQHARNSRRGNREISTNCQDL